MKKKPLLIWVIGALIVLAGSLFCSSKSAIYCWDGIEVDKELLYDSCGITPEEYFSEDFNQDSCPEAVEAVHMVGGCETDWSSALVMTAFIMVGYLLLSGFGYLLWRIFARRKLSDDLK